MTAGEITPLTFYQTAMKALRDAGVLVETPGGDIKLANPLLGETK